MFNIFKRKSTEQKFFVEELPHGKFGIVGRTNGELTAFEGEYTRKRDAVRGAARKGIALTA